MTACKTATLAVLNLENVTRDTVRLAVPLLIQQGVTSAEELMALFEQQPTCAGRHTEIQFLKAWSTAYKIEERCRQLNIAIIALWDDAFPHRLAELGDCPPILFAKGELDALNAPVAVAIVGTREPTPFGKGSAVRISEFFTEQGMCIVSGLARGCDTLAHKGCLRVGGKTVAVLAHGLDRIYPPENAELACTIIETGGCLVSEYPPGTKPTGLAFVERDRIQSGLSDATIVIETGIKGGTLHTANYCLQQGRLLAAIVHPEKYQTADKVQGNKMLIYKRGALPIADRNDLEEKLLPYLLECKDGAKPSGSWKTEQQLRMQLK